MNNQEADHLISREVMQDIFESLKHYYHAENKPSLYELVSYDFSIDYAVDYDNWNGGTYFHQLNIYLPLDKLSSYTLTKNDEKDQLLRDILPHLSQYRNEGINLINFVPEKEGCFHDNLFDSEIDNLWDDHGHKRLRVFLSHKSSHKKKVADLKTELQKYGCSCFVAHEDIETNKKWVDEIIKALASMGCICSPYNR